MIAGSKVRLENANTGVTNSAVTNEAGNFDFIAVPIGTYSVKAEAKGFQMTVTEDFTMKVSARQRVNVTLTVGRINPCN